MIPLHPINQGAAVSGVKYRFAADQEGQVVSIESEGVTRSSDYTCLSCRNILRPVLGQMRKKHFRHKYDVNCSPETYLHNLAKMTFYGTYRSCLDEGTPFWLEHLVLRECTFCTAGPCKVKSGYERTDLTRFFPEIHLEQRDGEFVPDILLTGDRKMYIEIAVTHRLEESKRASGLRIIEIVIRNEGDVDMIQSSIISVTDKRVRSYNFRPRTITGDFQGACEKSGSYFYLDQKGETWLQVIDLPKYFSVLSQGDYAIPVEDHNFETFHANLTQAFRTKKQIRHCWLCVHHTIHYRTQKNYCNKWIRGTGGDWPTEAIKCEDYRMGPEDFVEASLRQVLESRKRGTPPTLHLQHPIDRVGTCVFCEAVTTEWWSYDSLSGSCKCNKCLKEGRAQAGYG